MTTHSVGVQSRADHDLRHEPRPIQTLHIRVITMTAAAEASEPLRVSGGQFKLGCPVSPALPT